MSLRLAVQWRCTAVGLSVLLAAAGHGLAADLSAELHVDRVTVYRQGAVVTRTGDVAVPEGSSRLSFRGLPAAIDSKTLHVNVAPESVQLGSVEIAKINEGVFVSDVERELRRKIEEANDRRVALQDDIATAQGQLKLLDSLGANPVGRSTKPAIDAASLTPGVIDDGDGFKRRPQTRVTGARRRAAALPDCRGRLRRRPGCPRRPERESCGAS